jgi:4-amino-4-deoxy-L-arabinose transferase-like glycosyltransferase
MTAPVTPHDDDDDDDDGFPSTAATGPRLPGMSGVAPGGPPSQSTEADTVIAVAAPPAQRAQREGPSRRGVLLLVLVLLVLWLARLGAAPLFDVDEGAFSEATREMLASHDFGHTTLNGADRWDKPILVYWLQAGSAAAFGLNEFALRLPSALCAVGWCLALALFAWRRFGPSVAIAAAGILATSLGPMLIGRAATADALLNLLLTLSTLDLWRHLENGEAAPRRRAFAWIGLGLLAKGPVAFVIPAAAAGLWLAFGRDRSRLVRLVSDGRAWAWMFAIATPWYAYALIRYGRAFVDGFLVKHNLDRFGGSLEGHGGSLFYYVLLLPLLMWPWTPMLWPLLKRARTRWNEPLGRFLLGWLAFVLVFFSISGTKLPHYVLYGFTPLVLLISVELAEVTRRVRLALAGTMLAVVAFGAFSPFIARTLAQHTTDGLYRALLSSAPVAPWIAAALPVAALVFAAVIWVPNVRNYLSDAEGALAGAVITAGFLVLAVLPWWGETVQAPIRQLARTVPIAQMNLLDVKPLVQWKLHQPSIGFYLGQPVPRVAGAGEPPDGDWALTRTDRLSDDERQRFEVVRELRGYALVRPANAASEPLSSIGAAHTAAEEAQAAAEAASAASAASAAAASAPPKPARGPHRKTR